MKKTPSAKKSTKVAKEDAAFSRRDMLRAGGLAVAAAGAVAASLSPPKAEAQQAPAALSPLGGGSSGADIFSVVETKYGKVQGITNAGIRCFRGVPYGADTGGKNRFMPPKAPAKWAGVKNCIGYAPISPQTPSPITGDYGQMIAWDRHVGDGGMSEDCLNLNVWTPGADGAKRAVMVSYHGGGWATGSGNGPMYDGAQLAKLSDVVVVTVNHRLAANGYTHLASVAGAPAEFKYAGVAGVMDMVASLEWVRDNIANFGGDPSRVMIFGQSGGGSKTSCLLATPKAKGLFHRAGIQSGSSLTFQTPEAAQRSAEALLKTLGVTKKNWGDLQKISWEHILEAQTTTKGANFSPVMDGDYLPHHPFTPNAPQESRDVPVIISTALEDAALRLINWDLDDAGLKGIFNERYPGKGDELMKLYGFQGPNKNAYLKQAQFITDTGARQSAITQAERKAALGGAPAYMYIWEWVSPTFGGKFGAVHGLDVDASFNNFRNNPSGGGDPEGRRMTKLFATTWATFAKTGNPNNELIPNWPAYDAKTRSTMIFDSHTRVEDNPRADIRKFIAANAGSARAQG
ncbi:MAG TPA: carboxylesterase family protein [Hyphomonadaceae bacterium]|jgi:para-nitrobenzyl esterase|nr:carboxylesterase family protein [Hyphomonadaceae bacterium]